jgi:hypothetical protein
MRRRAVLTGLLGAVAAGGLAGAVALRGAGRGGSAPDSSEGPWAQVTLRVAGMT